VSTPTSTTEQAPASRGFGLVELLEHLAGAALDNRDKGDKPERPMKAYLRTDPMHAAKYSNVWL
jgi:predicted helicase